MRRVPHETGVFLKASVLEVWQVLGATSTGYWAKDGAALAEPMMPRHYD